MSSPPLRIAVLALVLALAFAAAVTVTACEGESLGGGSGNDGGTPVAGGTLVYPLSGDPVSIEPLNAQDASGLQVARQVFQGLTRWVRDDSGGLVTRPDIAAEWESTDAQTWTFHLKQGVTFQAPVSRPVTAEDFVASWTRATDPENGSYVAYILAPLEGCDDRGFQIDPEQGLTGVTAIDDHTLEIRLRYPLADLPAVLGHPVAAVTPVDYVDEVGDEAYAKTPVGTGPYVVAAWRRGKEIRLTRNAAYWDAENAGWVDAVELPIYEDVESMWADFEADRLDCSQLPAGQVEAVSGSPSVAEGAWTVGRWPAAAVYLVGMNMRDPVLGSDPELRQAVSQSAAAPAAVAAVAPGVAEVADGYVPPGIPGHKDEQNPYPYDPEAAAGHVAAMDAPPALRYWHDVGEDHRLIAATLVAGWAEAGLSVTASGYEWGTFVEKLSRGGAASDSQLFRVAWIADYPSMDAFLYPLFQSDNSRTGSHTFYSSVGVDELLQKARATLDANQRQNLYAQAEKLILSDMPAVPLYFYRYVRVVGSRLHAFSVDPMGVTDLRAVWLE